MHFDRKRLMAAAALFSVSLIIKPLGLMLMPLFLLKKHSIVAVATILVSILAAVPYFVADPDGLSKFWQINLEAIPAPGWVVHGGNQGLHGLLTRLLTSMDGVSTARLASFQDLSDGSRLAQQLLPITIGTGLLFITFRRRPALPLLYLLWSSAYLLCYKDVWEASYAFIFPAIALCAEEMESFKTPGVLGSLNEKLFWGAAIALAAPTAFVIYDVPLPPGPIDPEHHWSLSVSL